MSNPVQSCALDEWVKRLADANRTLELVVQVVRMGTEAFTQYAAELRTRSEGQ